LTWFVAFLLLGLALFGLIFAVSGVYGVMALEVARRRREVGLRVALGATAANVVGHMVRRWRGHRRRDRGDRVCAAGAAGRAGGSGDRPARRSLTADRRPARAHAARPTA
jgi:hypothetical protein